MKDRCRWRQERMAAGLGQVGGSESLLGQGRERSEAGAADLALDSRWEVMLCTGGAGWDIRCLGRGCTELEVPGRWSGAERGWKGGGGWVWCQWEVCAGREDTVHAACTGSPPECGCGFQGAVGRLSRWRTLEGPIRVAGIKRQA